MEQVTAFCPWGWSAQIKRRIAAMGFPGSLLPSDDSIGRIRSLSNRRTAIMLLCELKQRGIDVPAVPVYATAESDVASFVESMPRSVVKAPWSGSGKGIMWGIGRAEVPLMNFCRGVIRRQGGVVCEHYLSPVQEFAMEFFSSGNGVSFAGYSLFNAVKGSYSGNLLAPDSKIEEILSGYIPREELLMVRETLQGLLGSVLRGSGYIGYLGVDMMVYRDDSGALRLNPCMEVNLRMNMGVVSRIVYDRFVSAGRHGRYCVNFYKEKGLAFEEHAHNMQRYPLVVEDGRVASGYLNLSPVTPENSYSAFIVIDK